MAKFNKAVSWIVRLSAMFGHGLQKGAQDQFKACAIEKHTRFKSICAGKTPFTQPFPSASKNNVEHNGQYVICCVATLMIV